jgi:Septum formation
MARGWKCPRCSTQNGEGVMNCAKCGLIQGGVYVPSALVPPEPAALVASPPVASAPLTSPSALPAAAQGVGAPLNLGSGEEPPPSGWVPPHPTPTAAPLPPRPLWRRIPIRLAIIGAIIVAGAIGGFITNATRSSEGDITKSGDLVSNDLRVGDCWDMKDRSATTVDNVVARPCHESHEYEVIFVGSVAGETYPTDDAFQAFVENACLPAFGTYIGKAYEDSALDVSWLYPDPETWKSGDRTVECSAYDPDNSTLTASVRGAAR